MPNYRNIAIQAAKRNGIDPNLFVRQINQESGFNPNARSGAGAIGIAQIVPKYHPGVDVTNPVASLNYAAHLMGTLYKQYGNYQQALSVYNSGRPDTYKDPGFAGGQTFNYVNTIMGAPSGRAPVAPAARPVPLLGASAPAPSQRPVGPSPLASIFKLGNQMVGLPSQNLVPLPAPAPVAAPTFTPAPLPFRGGGFTPAPLPLPNGTKADWVKLAATADRSGVNLHPEILGFVSQVAHVYGKPLTIGTGTNHNQFVAGTHRESAHWTGYAADIPATGTTLTRLGQDALIAAGANPAWARRQHGGLFNVGGKQIIFNSMEGGNHFNHLHVGIRS